MGFLFPLLLVVTALAAVATGCGAVSTRRSACRGQVRPGGSPTSCSPTSTGPRSNAFDRVGELLRAQRPAPAPGLLTRVAAGPEGEAPSQLRLQVAVALLLGLLLLGLAALGASGSGPLGG